MTKQQRHPVVKIGGRLAGHKSKTHKEVAKERYGSKKGRGYTRDQQLAHTSPSVVDKETTDSLAAYRELKEFLFCKQPLKCPHCKGKLTGPDPYPCKKKKKKKRSNAYKGKLYLRCTSYGCRRRFNVVDFSKFKGTRLSLSGLLRTVTFYARTNRMRAPLVRDAAGQLKIPRKSVEHVYKVLRNQEAAAGVAFCRKKKISGNVEGDAHGLRKIYVSNGNQNFQDEIADATRRWKKSKKGKGKKTPSYWQGHVRIIGVKQRDGDGVVAVLPVKLVPPHASPPPESTCEVVGSKILKNIDPKKKSVLFSDGAHAWPHSLKQENLRNIKNVAVSHRKLQWIKKFSGKYKKPKSTKDGGTQMIDRWWESVDGFVPRQIHNKCKKGGAINHHLLDYVFGFVWRYQLKDTVDMKTELGKICEP